MPSRSYSNERSESDAKSFQLMTDMHNEIQRKEEIIEQLKQLIEVLKQRERERDAPIGLVIIQSVVMKNVFFCWNPNRRTLIFVF